MISLCIKMNFRTQERTCIGILPAVKSQDRIVLLMLKAMLLIVFF